MSWEDCERAVCDERVYGGRSWVRVESVVVLEVWWSNGKSPANPAPRKRASVQCDGLGRTLRAATAAMRRMWTVCGAVEMAMRAI
jgi:hypothetical protein